MLKQKINFRTFG